MRVSWSLASPGVNALVREARLCEKVGLDGVWLPDYEAPFSDWPELYVSLTAIAINTRHPFIGSLVTDVLRRHPMVTAHAFSSLSHIAPGRVILGLGAGAGTSHKPYGIALNHLASRLEEGLRVIRLLWSAESDKPVNFHGRFFRLEGAGPPLKPKGEIPIYVASYGPRMLRLTAELADGWIPEAHTPSTYRLFLEKLMGLRDKTGRSRERFEPCLAAIYYPFEPGEEAYNRLLRAAKHYLVTYPDILWASGHGVGHPGLRTQNLVVNKDLWSRLAEEVPNGLADLTIIYGDVDECIERVMRFREAGCLHIILEPYWIEEDRLLEAVELAGRIKVEVGEFTSL
jgi:phthiodiolone/phenolphthiodiolone dimycocerosates ketoreductase